MKLYDFKPAPNPMRLNLFMAEKGIEIPAQQIDMMTGEHLSDAYRAINPEMTLPALILDDGTLLTEVIGMFSYLESEYPENPLMGKTSTEKALVLGWDHRCYIEGLGGVADILRNSSKAFKGRALPGSVHVPQIPELIERGKVRVPAFFNLLNQHLEGRNFMVGDSFTAADISAFVFVHFCSWVKIGIPENCTNVQAWFDHIIARPAVAGVMAELAG